MPFVNFVSEFHFYVGLLKSSFFFLSFGVKSDSTI